MNSVNQYLVIPREYCWDWGGDLAWSDEADAIVTREGAAFALTHEIALFLDGFVASRRLLHFGFVLHLLRLLGHGRPQVLPVPDQAEPLAQAYRLAGRPLRNAGAFCAVLCQAVPAVADPIDVDRLSRLWISNSALMSLLCAASESASFHTTEEPPLRWDQFEDQVLEALGAYTADEIEHWLRHGRGPVIEAGDPIAEEVLAAKPRTLTGVLAELARRGRLTGAVPFVDQLVGILSLPPRRLTPSALPVDGYTDVTTRGQPEQLLPSQFALDDLEFIRRFAARELLYFRREEPHAPLREELVLLLDQGVRTWGDVRLVLSAAVFALGKRAARKDTPLHLATTGSGGTIHDFRTDDPEALGQLLESSDLSEHPALALERVLEEPIEGARDVVLLTHPRTLAEPDVAAAAHRAAGPLRLFAVTVDEHGQAEFVEMKHGTPVSLCRFRIDWSRHQPATDESTSAAEPRAAWSGAVEPVGFPFRFGVTECVTHFAFDTAGEWLLIAAERGTLHLERIDGGPTEVLPRGWLNNTVLREVEAVLGVPGGFVVGGRIDMEMVAFHYNLVSRTCRAHILGVPDTAKRRWYKREWYYHQGCHSVVVQTGQIIFGVDLSTGQRGSHFPGRPSGGKERVLTACVSITSYSLPPPRLPIRRVAKPSTNGNDIYLDKATGQLEILCEWHSTQSSLAFTPLADGKPALQDRTIQQAQLAGQILALSTYHSTITNALHLFVLPQGIPHREYPGHYRDFLLSPLGNKLARSVSNKQVFVHDVASGRVVWTSTKGKCHHDVAVRMGDSWLSAHIGSRNYLLRWDGPKLKHQMGDGNADAFLSSALGGSPSCTQATPLHNWDRPGWNGIWYDSGRFQLAIERNLIAVVDCFGQIMIYNLMHELLCIFFIFRDKFAVWMPDGTRYGPPALTGGPPTADALTKIGQTLRTAAGSVVRRARS